MQSFSLLPPILENQLEAIQWVATPSFDQQNSIKIQFQLSTFANWDEIRHVQIAIREKTTNNIAVNPTISPDKQVIYLQRNATWQTGNSNYEIISYNSNSRLCTLYLPFQCFVDGQMKQNTVYNIQIRFGSSNLWFYYNDNPTGSLTGNNVLSGINPSEVSSYQFENFATWRKEQVSNGNFGEWSNISQVFCYNNYRFNCNYVINNFIPNIVCTYEFDNTSGITDSLEQIAVSYRYQDMYGTTTKNLIFNTISSDLTQQSVNFEIPIARLSPIVVIIEGYTTHNIKLNYRFVIPVADWGAAMSNQTDYLFENNTNLLTPDEKEDGVLSFHFCLYNTVQNQDIFTYSIYRVNLFTLETVELVNNNVCQTFIDYFFKDFSVEMGEEYLYIIILYVNNQPYYLSPIIDALKETNDSWGLPGYGRLMRMDSIFLTSKQHQLRLSGNVKLSGLKRNTSDSFQTTIGGKYPFYSRSSEMNYRTFNLEGLVTILFDPTSAFFYNDLPNGLYWQDEDAPQLFLDDLSTNTSESRLVVLNRDLYHNLQYSLSTQRVNKKQSKIKTLDHIDPEDQTGPISIFNNILGRDISRFNETDHDDEMVYVERKFRDYVMNWLSDGKPKLFRSETEGNMIVMLTGINFSPYEASGRKVYQMSATATEIAEYNNENLIKYNIIPVNIKTQKKEFPTMLYGGDVVSATDYQNLIHINPFFAFCFRDWVGNGIDYTYTTLDNGFTLSNDFITFVSKAFPNELSIFTIDNGAYKINQNVVYKILNDQISYLGLEDRSLNRFVQDKTTFYQHYQNNENISLPPLLKNGSGRYVFQIIKDGFSPVYNISSGISSPYIEQAQVYALVSTYNKIAESDDYIHYCDNPILFYFLMQNNENQDVQAIKIALGENVSLEQLKNYYKNTLDTSARNILAILKRSKVIGEDESLEIETDLAQFVPQLLRSDYYQIFSKFGYDISINQLKIILKNNTSSAECATIKQMLDEWLSSDPLNVAFLSLLNSLGTIPQYASLQIDGDNVLKHIENNHSYWNHVRHIVILALDKYRIGNPATFLQINIGPKPQESYSILRGDVSNAISTN